MYDNQRSYEYIKLYTEQTDQSTPKNVTYKQKWSKGNCWQLDYLEIEQALQVEAAWPKWSVYDR